MEYHLEQRGHPFCHGKWQTLVIHFLNLWPRTPQEMVGSRGGSCSIGRHIDQRTYFPIYV